MTELFRCKIIKCPECDSENIEKLKGYNIFANSNYRCKECGYFLDNHDDLPRFGELIYATYKLPEGEWQSTLAWDDREEGIECVKSMARGRGWLISGSVEELERLKKICDEAT